MGNGRGQLTTSENRRIVEEEKGKDEEKIVGFRCHHHHQLTRGPDGQIFGGNGQILDSSGRPNSEFFELIRGSLGSNFSKKKNCNLPSKKPNYAS